MKLKALKRLTVPEGTGWRDYKAGEVFEMAEGDQLDRLLRITPAVVEKATGAKAQPSDAEGDKQPGKGGLLDRIRGKGKKNS